MCVVLVPAAQSAWISLLFHITSETSNDSDLMCPQDIQRIHLELINEFTAHLRLSELHLYLRWCHVKQEKVFFWF